MSPVAVMEGSKPDLELESELHRIIIKKKKKTKLTPVAPQTVKSNIFIFTPHLLENPCPQKVWPRSSEEPAEQQEESSDQFLWAEEV